MAEKKNISRNMTLHSYAYDVPVFLVILQALISEYCKYCCDCLILYKISKHQYVHFDIVTIIVQINSTNSESRFYICKTFIFLHGKQHKTAVFNNSSRSS